MTITDSPLQTFHIILFFAVKRCVQVYIQPCKLNIHYEKRNMENYEKKKVNSHGIDEKAIMALVGNKDLRHTVCKPSEEANVNGSTSVQATASEELAERMAYYEKEYLHCVPSETRRSLHVDAVLHQQLSSLIWALGRGDVTMEGYVNRLLARHFEEYNAIIENKCRKVKI